MKIRTKIKICRAIYCISFFLILGFVGNVDIEVGTFSDNVIGALISFVVGIAALWKSGDLHHYY